MGIKAKIEHRQDDGKVSRFEIDPQSEATKRCGVSFNPTADPTVDKIKSAMAVAMQAIIDETDPSTGSNDHKRCIATAKTHLEAAQMFAVKARFQ